MRKIKIVLLLVVALFTAQCGSKRTKNTELKKPNVVILYTDDQGTLDVNCYGATDLETPNMDKIATAGIRFTRGYAHTVCCPSRAAVLTGRHPQRSGITGWTQGDRNGSDSKNKNLPVSEVTLAEVLKDAGYETGLFGKWHLGAKEGHGPIEQGFDTYFGHLSGFIDNYRHVFMKGDGYHDLYDGNTEIFRDDEYFPELMTKKALEFLDKDRDKPFFMMASFNLPHYPEQPLGPYANAYPEMEMPRQSYARVVSSVDHLIGKILNKLEKNGHIENTILIMMSDNGHSEEGVDGAKVKSDKHVSKYPVGYYFGANGGGGYTGKWIGSKGTFLEGGIRVPAMISYPARIPKGEVRHQAITAMDWFPTVLELAGISRPDLKLDGKSMMPVIEDDTAPSAHSILHFGWARKWSVTRGEWKLLGLYDRDKRIYYHQLVNLSGDKPEQKDYSKEKPELVNELKELHDAWFSEVSIKNK